ncbi:P-loop containing nucleoside triphosphate hydrolase protein [Schizophyllum amplum]|uniref:P-loop containing nucleoside triphosphate hydrolase protein n=1 Tax=Schizophyllum amplum TaxID=97359 RepID=A0A550CAU9_9AGAR|nr:P-loop containing nucleoside triphosphate hydrolase protein [Auriculariopsis ampla]
MPTSFAQVHLPPHTIDSVRTIVSLPLLHPTAFQRGILKEHGMTGCLLFGPPGTGKTLVVRALAKEAGVRMMTISPSDVMDMLVRAVFSLARRLSPCVVFLDEIDALFGARMSARESGGAFAHRGVITEFMQEMDGLTSSKEDNVIVIGATNRPFDLDDAVLRRLPRRLLVDLPGEKERDEILKILLRDETLGADVATDLLAKRTESFSGSDLKHLCVSAALDAVKETVTVPWSNTSKPASEVREAEVVSQAEPSAEEASAPEPASAAEPASQSGNAAPEPCIKRTAIEEKSELPPRVLSLRHFEKAMREITPSSSESLGSLAELRKWNDEFGEGRKDRRRKQVWGKGSFGFTDRTREGEAGRVAPVLPEVMAPTAPQPEMRASAERR